MPTELEELVGFLNHGNTQLRQAAVEHLVPYSKDASIFKKPQMTPVDHLKLLVKDYKPIAQNVLTMLINLSHDSEILEQLARDDTFIENLLKKITDPKDSHADLIAMLLSNLAKSDTFSRIVTQTRMVPPSKSSTSARTLDQLMDLFVKGADQSLNPNANYDYLAYLFADISKHKEGRHYFVTRQSSHDDVVPITKLTVFTEHKSHIRRRGVASTIKNVAFEIDSHAMLLMGDDEDVVDINGTTSGQTPDQTVIEKQGETQKGANLLPYLLLPLAGAEDYREEELAQMLPDLQLLPPDKHRDHDPEILHTHLETLLLLTTTKAGREIQRNSGVYPIVRECHLHVENEDVRAVCDRLVQVLMRDEEEDAAAATATSGDIPVTGILPSGVNDNNDNSNSSVTENTSVMKIEEVVDDHEPVSVRKDQLKNDDDDDHTIEEIF